MDYFFISLLKSWLNLTIVILIPAFNGIACFFIFRRIINKILVGIALVLGTFIANLCIYFFIYFLLFSVFMHRKPVGTEPPLLYTVHLIITIFICGCFTVWLYKVGIDNVLMRKQD